MDRLTYDATGTGQYIQRCACTKQDLIDRLAYYEDLEEQGRLIVLPCKLGDTVYAVEPDLCDLRGNDTCNAFCDGWEFSCPDFHPGNTIRQRHFQIEDLRCFGETVFRSYDEAEAALGGDKK